jgi:ABC-type maltose transport system permease subunit
LIGPYTAFGLAFATYVMTGSLVLFSVPVLVLYFLLQPQFIEGLTAGAMKQ